MTAPDLLVVGAGVMGAWTALEARRDGRTVTLLDAFGAGHARATSGDQTRISRCGHGADALYSRWARDSRTGWRATRGRDRPGAVPRGRGAVVHGRGPGIR